MYKTELLTKLLSDYGSPVYLYNYCTLVNRCNKIAEFIRSLELALGVKVSAHYSTKANSNPSIIAVVESSGLSIDAMSPFELEIAQRCGFPNDRILYVCNNISVEEMTYVYDKGILICLDSISQVERLGKVRPGAKIMVRINPGTSGVGHSEKVKTAGKKTKFGISEENLPELFQVIEKYNLQIVGTHQHLGSLFLDDKIPDYIAGVEAGLNIIKKYFNNVEIVDLGGGFGVPYSPDEKPLSLNKVYESLIPLLMDFIKDYPSVKEFKFEPGRYIPCEAGSILAPVEAVKHENGTWYIGTSIGMNQLVRPSMYDSYHEIKLIYLSDCEHPSVTATFCGNICESGDILGKNRVIGLPKVGDLVLVENAGAYGYSMASNYTGRQRPAEVMIYPYDDSVKCIRERETIDSMLQFCKFPK